MAKRAPSSRHRPRAAIRPGLWLVLAGVVGFAPSAVAQNGTVYITPAAVAQMPMVDFTVTILADAQVPELACYAITLDYDHDTLALVSAQEGSLFAGSSLSTFFSLETDTQGRDVLTNCVLGFGTSVQPAGELATVTFRGLQSGGSSIQMVEAIFRDADRAVIGGVQLSDAFVAIGTVGAPSVPPAPRPRLIARPNPAGGPVRFELVDGQLLSAVAPAKEGDAGAGAGGPLARIVVYDLAGRRVRWLAMPADAVVWDGRDQTGRPAASGVYFAVATTRDGQRATTKLIRLD